MKTPTILFLFFCFLATTHVQAQLKAVDYPVYSSKNSDFVEITRIERNDTATIVSMEVYNRPNYWIKITSKTTLHGVTTGKDYKLLFSKGFELDKEVYMPASGNKSFQLFFEPLDKKELKINLIEGTNDRDFKIENLELNENYKKSRICCHLSGTVIDRPESSRLILCKDLSDARTSCWLSIPIHNGKFDYKFYTDIEDKFTLVFWDEYINGAMRPISFFAENGNIQFTLRPFSEKTPTSDIETTCPLTNEMITFEKQTREKFQYSDIAAAEKALMEADGYYTEIYKEFWKKFEATKVPEERDKLYKERDALEESGAFYTDAAKALNKKGELRNDSSRAWRLQYIAQHPTLPSLYSLREIIYYLNYKKKDISPCVDVYTKVLEKKFSKHPAGKAFQQFIDGMSVKVGHNYINFTAPDLQGNQIQLSDVIKNKVAVIDFWASWCGPCRRHSISLIPVYNKYKDKGFTIVGISREKNDTKDMESAIKQDGYTWLNLVDLNDKAKIWSKYGIPNAAGSIFLVDKSGRILAINPSAEEIEAILEKTL